MSILDKYDLKLDLDLAPNAIRQISDSKWRSNMLGAFKEKCRSSFIFYKKLSKLSLKTRAIVSLDVTLSVGIFEILPMNLFLYYRIT